MHHLLVNSLDLLIVWFFNRYVCSEYVFVAGQSPNMKVGHRLYSLHSNYLILDFFWFHPFRFGLHQDHHAVLEHWNGCDYNENRKEIGAYWISYLGLWPDVNYH